MTDKWSHATAVYDKVVPVASAAKCTICETMQADCLRFKTGWFGSGTICDGCLAVMLRMCDKRRGGEVEDGDG